MKNESSSPPPLKQSKIDNYHSERGAEAYKRDYQERLHRQLSDRRERRIFARYFDRLGRVDSVLDLPCGAGRLFEMLSGHADRVIEADFSPSMIELNRRDHDGAADRYLECSALDIPLAENEVELIVSVRLSHHLHRPEDRRRHLEELFRVARRAVIVTWFDYHSIKNCLRRIRAPFDKKRAKNTMRKAEVREIARACGFRPVAMIPLSRLASGHVFGLFEAESAGPPSQSGGTGGPARS